MTRDVNREIDRLIKRADALRTTDSHAQLVEIRKMVELLEAMPDGSKVRESHGRIVLPRDKRNSVSVDAAMTRDKILENIRRDAAQAGITGRQLAQELGIEEATMSRKLSGKTDFTLSELLTIAKTLNMPPALLIDGTRMPEPPKRDMYSINEVATMLGMSRDYVANLIHTGQLDAIKPAHTYLITRRSYEKFIGK